MITQEIWFPPWIAHLFCLNLQYKKKQIAPQRCPPRVRDRKQLRCRSNCATSLSHMSLWGEWYYSTIAKVDQTGARYYIDEKFTEKVVVSSKAGFRKPQASSWCILVWFRESDACGIRSHDHDPVTTYQPIPDPFPQAHYSSQFFKEDVKILRKLPPSQRSSWNTISIN